MKKYRLIIGALLAVSVLTSTYFLKSAKANYNEGPSKVFSNVNYQEDPVPYDIGSEVKDFKLKNVDGSMVSLSSIDATKGYIVLFTSNHCPFSQAYEDRIIQLNGKYKPLGFPVLAINSNDPAAYEEDNFDNMVKVAKDKGFTFPYLSDDNQEVGKTFGASRTPQAFVLNKEDGKIIVRYIGALDDNAQSPSDVTKKFVDDAVDNLINGKPVANPKTKAIGCAIRWK